MDIKPVLHFAAKFEFYVIAVTFVIAICLLSLSAAGFIIGAVLQHTFPNWLTYVRGAYDVARHLL